MWGLQPNNSPKREWFLIQVRTRLGVKTRVFHLGDYRRATVGPGQDVPDDYFFINGKTSGVLLITW